MIKPITLPPLPDDLIAHRMTETEVRSLLKRYGERCATAAIEADRKEIMKPALERADLAFIYDELLQSGKDRAAELVRAAILAKHGHATLPYNLDTDPAGVRALAADAIRGAIGFGAQGVNPPPEGHWLTEFWEAGMYARNGDKES